MSGVVPESARRARQPVPEPRPGWSISLDDVSSGSGSISPAAQIGAKAANLARARRAGLPVLAGLVLPVDAAAAYADATAPDHDEVVADWLDGTAALARSAGAPLVVRSTAPDEDAAARSQAGRYTSVLDVAGRPAIDRATRDVIASGDGAMAVLAQPLVVPAISGVLFGLDPVTGRTDRLVVAAVSGLPDQLVAGRVSPTHYHLSRRGRVRHVEQAPEGPAAVLDAPTARRLARLAGQVRRLFGHPQDVEWAVDAGGRLWLLQSRPITTQVPVPASDAVLGVAGVDETFPDRLSPLEADLWVPPLRDGLRHALRVTRAFSARTVAASPLVTEVGGRVVADQLLVGRLPVRRHWFDPRPPMRRVSAAWRVGRLRGALLPLGARAVARADRSLLALPPPGELPDEDLLGAIGRAGDSLVALHGTEILAGMLLGPHVDTATATVPVASAVGEALGVLRRSRRSAPGGGNQPTDEALVARFPVLLALSPPRIGARVSLPPSLAPAGDAAQPTADGSALLGVAAPALDGAPLGAAAAPLDGSPSGTAATARDGSPSGTAATARDGSPSGTAAAGRDGAPPRDGAVPPRDGAAPLDGAAAPAPIARRRGRGDRGRAQEARAQEVGLLREALRLRARWVQEAQATMVGELARRLCRDGLLPDASSVRLLRADELARAVRRGEVPADLAERAGVATTPAAELPDTFRLGTDGRPIPVDPPAPVGGGAVHGRGAGGGRGSGPVVHQPEAVVAGAVLVTGTLEPRLAPLLPALAGLVAETGSPLSHLAIVAREHGVPTVVGVPRARRELPVGSRVLVDGTTGVLARLDEGSDVGDPAIPGASSTSGGRDHRRGSDRSRREGGEAGDGGE